MIICFHLVPLTKSVTAAAFGLFWYYFSLLHCIFYIQMLYFT